MYNQSSLEMAKPIFKIEMKQVQMILFQQTDVIS